MHDGGLLGYSAPVLDDDPDHPDTAQCPLLFGLEQMNDINIWSCSKTGQLVSLFEGVVVQWPAGTRKLQCENDPGGHWLLGVGHWDKVSRQERNRVQQLLANGGPPA